MIAASIAGSELAPAPVGQASHRSLPAMEAAAREEGTIELDVSHAKSKRKRKGFRASRRTARLSKRAQRLLDEALNEPSAARRAGGN